MPDAGAIMELFSNEDDDQPMAEAEGGSGGGSSSDAQIQPPPLPHKLAPAGVMPRCDSCGGHRSRIWRLRKRQAPNPSIARPDAAATDGNGADQVAPGKPPQADGASAQGGGAGGASGEEGKGKEKEKENMEPTLEEEAKAHGEEGETGAAASGGDTTTTGAGGERGEAGQGKGQKRKADDGDHDDRGGGDNVVVVCETCDRAMYREEFAAVARMRMQLLEGYDARWKTLYKDFLVTVCARSRMAG